MSDEPKRNWRRLIPRNLGLIATLLALCLILEVLAEIVERH
ncbi:MAG TPA: hypothetical protein VG055_25765 [Planctomycetaceae bacterium]|jgi:hypothetical protein|nr:hypothetical protein [Planctomycetaceae bacterium]